MVPVGFALLGLQGISEIIKCVLALTHELRARVRLREAAAMIELLTHYMAPLMFVGLIFFMVIGYPAAFSLAAVGLFFGLIAIELGLIAPDFLGNLTYQLFSVLSNELLLAIPFFTFMGVILERCGLAEDLLEGFGQLFGGVRGGLSYAVILVGAILGAITGTVAASVIAMGLISLPVMTALRLQRAPRDRRHRRVGHDHPAHPAVAGADRAGRPARQLAGRHVYRRHRRQHRPGAAVRRLGADPVDRPAALRAGPAAGSAHAARLAADLEMHPRHGAVAGADLHRARHDLHGPCDADRGRRHGRRRRHAARLDQPPADLEADLSGHGHRPCGSPPWWCSSCSARASSAWSSRASAAATGSRTC